MTLKVCMFVYNNFNHDTRVLKEAKSLIANGYDVTVIALLDDNSKQYEQRNGIRIIRVIKYPLHYRILKWLKEFNPLVILSSIRNSLTQSFKQTLKQLLSTLKALGKQSQKDDQEQTSWWRLLKEAFDKRCYKIQEKGKKAYFQEQWQKNPYFILSINGFLFITYSLYQVIDWCYYRVVQRPAKIFWVRYLKRLWYWGVKRPAKIFWHRYLYRTVNKILAPVHRQLCFLDYHYRSLEIVTQQSADIYHAHDLNVLPAAYQAARKNGAKLVYDSHEFYVERNRQHPLNPIGKFILGRIERFLMRRSNAVITVSDTIAQELAHRYRVTVPTVILNTPPQTTEFLIDERKSIRIALGINPNHYLLLYSGGITFNRGLEKVIESLIYLPNCHFVLMGYGREKYIEELKALAIKSGVDSRLSLFGPVPSEEVTTYAASADLGIAAIENVCLSYYYCAPNKLFEYISAGLPVIASNFPEMKKIIKQYEIGSTFDPSQPQDIARVAQEVLSNSKRLQQMRKNTFAAAKDYNWENESDKLLKLYQTLT